MTYPSIRKATTKSRVDKATWADRSLLITSFDVIGSGTIITPLVDFGLVFENVPFFTWGVETQPGEVLTDDNFPAVMCGIREWQLTEVEADPNATPYYIGAFIWVYIVSFPSYRLRLRFSFEGITMRNVEHFRGL